MHYYSPTYRFVQKIPGIRLTLLEEKRSKRKETFTLFATKMLDLLKVNDNNSFK